MNGGFIISAIFRRIKEISRAETAAMSAKLLEK